MKIYTKTGDSGETSLVGGRRVHKHDIRIQATGTLDELNAALGIVRTFTLPPNIDPILQQIQRALFTIGSHLSCPPEDSASSRLPRLSDEDIENLERVIDDYDARLPVLQHFILPGGNSPGAFLHFARTVSRRAERIISELLAEDPTALHYLKYINRLSDTLFVLARWANNDSRISEMEWHGTDRERSE